MVVGSCCIAFVKSLVAQVFSTLHESANSVNPRSPPEVQQFSEF